MLSLAGAALAANGLSASYFFFYKRKSNQKEKPSTL
jgi:hypothetical protein